MVFYWRLIDSKSPQVSRTLLSILAVFNNAVVWMVSTRPPTSKSSRPFNNPLVTVPKAPIPISIIVTFIFHSFFQFSCKVEVFILLFTFFQLYSVVSRDSKVDNFSKSITIIIIVQFTASKKDVINLEVNTIRPWVPNALVSATAKTLVCLIFITSVSFLKSKKKLAD